MATINLMFGDIPPFAILDGPSHFMLVTGWVYIFYYSTWEAIDKQLPNMIQRAEITVRLFVTKYTTILPVQNQEGNTMCYQG